MATSFMVKYNEAEEVKNLLHKAGIEFDSSDIFAFGEGTVWVTITIMDSYSEFIEKLKDSIVFLQKTKPQVSEAL